MWDQEYTLIEDELYSFDIRLDGVVIDSRSFIVNCDGLAPAKPAANISYACDTLLAVMEAVNGGETPIPFQMVANGVIVESGMLEYGKAVIHNINLVSGTHYDLSVTVGGVEYAKAQFDLSCPDINPTTTTTTIPTTSTTIVIVPTSSTTSTPTSSSTSTSTSTSTTLASAPTTTIQGTSTTTSKPTTSAVQPTTTNVTKVLGASGFNARNQFDFKQATLAYTGSQTAITIAAALCLMAAGGFFYSSSRLRARISARRG